MCGISGIINFNNQAVKENELRLMMQKMKHRGPDDEGLFIDNNFGLGFVRLSILDLSQAGHQPMFSNDDNLVIVFNGEVFNYIEIRQELSAKYHFKTNTDTEVILAAFQEWGEKCLDKFNGMFAFVIYNIQTKEIFGARDRYGIKPFYYFIDENSFIFASEIKSILPLVKNQANDNIIYDYLLRNKTNHNEETFFKNIKKLQHGAYFTLKKSEFTIFKWYDLAQKISKNKELSPAQYRVLFRDSLKLRLRADVPIGVSLSGGIDSSAIVSSLVYDFNLAELNTFSAVYGKDEASDESQYIDQFRTVLKNMHFISPTAESFFDDFETFIVAHNQPVPDIGPYVQFKVMEKAAEFVTITLDGQGADEQLAGYHYFFGTYFLELIKDFKFARFINENIQYLKKHKSLNALKYLLFYSLSAKYQNKLLEKTNPSVHQDFIHKFEHQTTINQMLYDSEDLTQSLLQHFEYKLEHLLNWEDLNSMHFSMESRVPFLDYRLVEATLSTPSNQKIYKAETKHLLRESLKDILPFKIANRKDKKGFSNPRDKWFRSEKFQSYILKLINSQSFKTRGYFDSNIANKQYKKHLAGKIDASKEIWKWINLELWFQKFID